MFQSFFNGLSGMFSFSRGLNNISNNIANMNTPGFRGNDSFFRSVNNGNGGLGTSLEGLNVRQHGGEVRQTGNSTDLALNGSGFFVLRDKSGALFYSRAGQFQFNSDGILVDSASQNEVMALDSTGNLQRIDIATARTLPAQGTSKVNFIGVINSSQTPSTVENIKVFDAAGNSHTLKMTLTRSAPSIWQAAVSDENGSSVGTGEVRYGPDNTPLSGFNELTVNLSNAGKIQAINLNFGDPGAFTGSYQNSVGQTSLGAKVVDGHAILGLNSMNFDETGLLKLTYSNGEKKDASRLALASFKDESQLSQASGSLYQAAETAPASFGRANEGVLGKIQGGAIELSNVDLTQEFADMMIIQRGYQASSRVMSVANEMVEQLYNSTRGG